MEQPEASPETSAMIAVADAISRGRFGNAGSINGQIGIEVAPCAGNCGMCVFGANFTPFQPQRLSLEDILLRARQFVGGLPGQRGERGAAGPRRPRTERAGAFERRQRGLR
jgi:hypothetical protein